MEWFENDEFWRELYPYMFPPERLAAATEQVAQLLALTNFKGRSVLDLCCGPGRHSVEFAKRGFDVTGVDRTQFLLDRARERAAESGVNVEWVLEDMRKFRRESAFDLVCSMFTSFGYFENPDEDLLVLRNILGSLRPGGIFLIETLGKEGLARIYKDTVCEEFPDGMVVLQRHQIRSDWTRVYNEWSMLKDGSYRTFRFEHTIYSACELKERLLAAGFSEVRVYSDLLGNPYGAEPARVVLVARKPG
jgi:SAM-dependent methyltransferase